MVRILYEELSPFKFNRISYCGTTFKILCTLSVTHEDMTQVKENKMNILIHKHELFDMGKIESIRELYAKL